MRSIILQTISTDCWKLACFCSHCILRISPTKPERFGRFDEILRASAIANRIIRRLSIPIPSQPTQNEYLVTIPPQTS